MDRQLKAHLSLFVANLIYGANYTIAKEVMPDYIMPFGFILLRVIGATLIFWILHLFYKKETILNKDYGKLAMCGLFGVAINQLLFFKGLDMSTPINAAIIMTANPVMVLIFAAIIIREAITFKKSMGILLGLSGAALVILQNAAFSISSETQLGDLLVFINATSYGLYLVLVKPLMVKYHPITIVKWVFLFGFIYVFPFGYGELSQVNWASMPTIIIACILFVVIGTTFFAYLLNIIALKELSPSIVSYYIYLQPILATVFALVLGKDEIDPIKIIGSVLIFSGVFLISTPSQKS
jgi:drug/metabolite transporter (DMT)-like permease